MPTILSSVRQCRNCRTKTSQSAAAAPPPPSLPSTPASPPMTQQKPVGVAPETIPSPSPAPSASLVQSFEKKPPMKSAKFFRHILRPFPIFSPRFKLPAMGAERSSNQIHGETCMTGTLFGRRKGRISLAIQETPSSSTPLILLELALPMAKLLQEMAPDHVRISLECQKRRGSKTRLMDEPVWTMHCDGQKTGNGKRREPTDEDHNVMQLLKVVSMGVGVLPSDEEEPSEGELTYVRANIERVIGSEDSETFYMASPDQNSTLEVSIFFLRI
eukprot:TRINITY_DN27782_c2_g1_i1.p1 TRINITY_DN27782_c2_g1~~TRINITY_DN27782_c2_g1_i1.p1  ORF type:complete len:273 (+),score=56.26 TRINITY_DN27782_c2_g1_i1:2670-3488(+)